MLRSYESHTRSIFSTISITSIHKVSATDHIQRILLYAFLPVETDAHGTCWYVVRSRHGNTQLVARKGCIR